MKTYYGIQAMRGIAALSVVCGHAAAARIDLFPEGLLVLRLLQGGVDIFFVISGFIIATTAAEVGSRSGRASVLDFAIKRVARIYPLYWVVLFASVISCQWISVSSWGQGGLDIAHVFSLVIFNRYVVTAWSLCFELAFYAAVTIILGLFPTRVMETLLAVLGAVIVADILGISLWVYSMPLTLEFGIGVVIAWLVRTGAPCPIPLAAVALGLILFSVGWILMNHGYDEFNTFVRLFTYGTGAGCLIYAVITAELNGAAFPKVLLWLGQISYSLYLTHFLLVTWLANMNPAWLTVWDEHPPLWIVAVRITASILLPIAVAATTYRLIELPPMRWARDPSRKLVTSGLRRV
ncbi:MULTISPECIES: acyltransferase [unclassified Bradyrhizobium]|uniref:acyltransferase family protein n=1 Tax=unclassified Bradyrhizobium TaxID=2631580 RepID=UPI003398C5CE